MHPFQETNITSYWPKGIFQGHLPCWNLKLKAQFTNVKPFSLCYLTIGGACWTHVLSWTKKIVIVDVVIVNCVMWAEGWERGEGGKSHRVGQLLPDRGPGWMGICLQEREASPSSK